MWLMLSFGPISSSAITLGPMLGALTSFYRIREVMC
jgi:hypothetical protein